MMTKPKILALLDGRPGNDNQTISIAEKLGEYESIKIEFNWLAGLPNFFLGSSLVGVKTKIEQTPDIIIATGRKLARVAAHMKVKTGCKAIQLMNPQMDYHKFDMIFVPEHDGIKPRTNIYSTFGAPNRIDANFLANYAGKFDSNINVALVGDIAPKAAKRLSDIKNLHITTSRRTKPATIAALRALQPTYLYEWKSGGENPYYNLLAAAENIIVSADSAGMISEACTTGKKVFIFGLANKLKFQHFIARLVVEDYALALEDFGATWQPNTLKTRDDVVKIIKDLI